MIQRTHQEVNNYFQNDKAEAFSSKVIDKFIVFCYSLTMRTAKDKLMVGRRMGAAMVEAGLTTEYMASRIGKTSQSVRGYLRGAHTPDPLVLQAWSEVTGKSVEYLLHGVDSQAAARSLPRADHVGVTALERDRALMRDLHVTPEEIETLRKLVAVTPEGYLEIDTKVQAMRWLDAIRVSTFVTYDETEHPE